GAVAGIDSGVRQHLQAPLGSDLDAGADLLHYAEDHPDIVFIGPNPVSGSGQPSPTSEGFVFAPTAMLNSAAVEHPHLWAAVACAVAVAGEGLFMGRQGSGWMRGLRQPRFAPPAWGWAFVGIAYYSLCFYILGRILGTQTVPVVCLALL